MGKASRRKHQVQLPGSKQRPAPGGSRVGPPALSRYQRISNDYGAPFLYENGPLIIGAWSVPRALAAALTAAGQPGPAPVQGAMLVDTGATQTSMSRKAATQLGLTPLRMQRGYGSGGEHEIPIYFASFEINLPGKSGVVVTMGWEQEAGGIADLEKHAQGVAVGVNPVEVIGLLGRDILRHVNMSYNGMTGRVELTFDITSLKLDPSR